MILLSIQGLFRTILIIVGIVFIMRFIGRVMIANRNIKESKDDMNQARRNDDVVDAAKRNFGKTTISKKKSNVSDNGQFTPYEEIEE